MRVVLMKSQEVVGWCDGLGKIPVPGRPAIRITVGQGLTALAVGAGGACLDIFTLIYPFSPLSLSLWETARYRLKYCLKGSLNPKQPTNQPERPKLHRVLAVLDVIGLNSYTIVSVSVREIIHSLKLVRPLIISW